MWELGIKGGTGDQNEQTQNYFVLDFSFDHNLEQTQRAVTSLKINTISSTHLPVKFSTLLGRLNFQLAEKMSGVNLRTVAAQKTIQTLTHRQPTRHPWVWLSHQIGHSAQAVIPYSKARAPINPLDVSQKNFD